MVCVVCVQVAAAKTRLQELATATAEAQGELERANGELQDDTLATLLREGACMQ